MSSVQGMLKRTRDNSTSSRERISFSQETSFLSAYSSQILKMQILGEKASPKAAPGAPVVPPCGYWGRFQIPAVRWNGDRIGCEAGGENFPVKNSPKSPKSTKKREKAGAAPAPGNLLELRHAQEVPKRFLALNAELWGILFLVKPQKLPQIPVLLLPQRERFVKQLVPFSREHPSQRCLRVKITIYWLEFSLEHFSSHKKDLISLFQENSPDLFSE